MYVLCVCLLLTQWTVVVAVVCAQSKSTFRGEISIQNVTSKLALLTMHFPKVSLYFVCPHPPPPTCMHACVVCVQWDLRVISLFCANSWSCCGRRTHMQQQHSLKSWKWAYHAILALMFVLCCTNCMCTSMNFQYKNVVNALYVVAYTAASFQPHSMCWILYILSKGV